MAKQMIVAKIVSAIVFVVKRCTVRWYYVNRAFLVSAMAIAAAIRALNIATNVGAFARSKRSERLTS